MLLPAIEKVISYKTKDNKIFTKEKNAIEHSKWLIEQKQFKKLVNQVTKTFKQDLDKYKEVIKEYEIDLETDFWVDNSDSLSTAASNEIRINNFEDYTKLIKILMEECHLEKVTKLINNLVK